MEALEGKANEGTARARPGSHVCCFRPQCPRPHSNLFLRIPFAAPAPSRPCTSPPAHRAPRRAPRYLSDSIHLGFRSASLAKRVRGPLLRGCVGWGSLPVGQQAPFSPSQPRCTVLPTPFLPALSPQNCNSTHPFYQQPPPPELPLRVSLYTPPPLSTPSTLRAYLLHQAAAPTTSAYPFHQPPFPLRHPLPLLPIGRPPHPPPRPPAVISASNP